MKLTDLLIIYFAVGAPFGVYQFTTESTPLGATASLRIFLRICFWPIFAVRVLADWFSKNSEVQSTPLDRQIDTIRAEIEELAFTDESISSVFDFREILLRYTGLSEAANMTNGGDAVNEFFEMSGSENKALASACLARKLQRRLEFHQSLVRDEFLNMIAEFAEAESARTRILELAVELANGVDDRITSDAVTAIMSDSRNKTVRPTHADTPLSISQSASSSI